MIGPIKDCTRFDPRSKRKSTGGWIRLGREPVRDSSRKEKEKIQVLLRNHEHLGRPESRRHNNLGPVFVLLPMRMRDR